MTIESKAKIKDNLIIISLIVNITLGLIGILGGMKWVGEINTAIGVLQQGQKANTDAISNLQNLHMKVKE